MLANQQHSTLAYLGTLILAMCLNILPLPELISHLNPDWVMLTLIYWTLVIPEKFGVFNAWLVGLFVDVLTGRLLGQQALTYALISYTSLKFHRRLRQYPVHQQSFFVFFCLLFSQMLVFWIENIDGNKEFTVVFWLPILTGTVCWPIVYSVLGFFRIFGHID